MKKLMFLTMMFGSMMVFSGSVSAQTGKVHNIDGSGKFKPVVGDDTLALLVKSSADYPEVGIKKNQSGCMLAVKRGKGQQVSAFMKMDCSQLKALRNVAKVTKVENPSNDDIMVNDNVTVNEAAKTITFTRGKISIKITYKQ